MVEAERRGLPHTHAATSTAAFLRALLRLDPRDANARVTAAHAAGPRRTLTGELLPPAFPLVAAAQAGGSLSPAHARVITRTITLLPDDVLDLAGPVEADLVAYAEQFDPHALGKLAARITALYHPDGALADHDYRQRHRDFGLTVRPDGSSTAHGELSAELTERLLCAFDALAGPRPETEGVKDPRTAGQRRHDALLDLLDLVQRAEVLPQVNGVAATIILTVDVEDFVAGTGLVRTGHGAFVPTQEAVRWAGGDTRTQTVILDRSVKSVTAYGSAHRIFTEGQRLAMIARDKGCSFPGCDRPPQWCQAHHITEWIDHGPTSLDNGTLLCGHHHRNFERLGWTVTMTPGTPHWTPPHWIDPTQTPRTNQAHG